MILQFDTSLCNNYSSESQSVRIMSEKWFLNNMYCPNCGNPRISHLPNNAPVADFQCDSCGEVFELKSKKGKIGKKVADGAYSTMINRITSKTTPDLFILQYSQNYKVTELTLIPCFFFIPEIIEKRKPLSKNAIRSGWTGCNILYHYIPKQGKITVIKNSRPLVPDDVIARYSQIKQLQTGQPHEKIFIICAKRPIILLAIQAIISILEVACFLSA